MSITEKLKSLALTPNQMVALLASIKSIDFMNSSPSGKVSEALLSGNMNEAFTRITATANDLFANGPKYTELINLITRVGVIRVVIGLIQMLSRELTGA